MYQSVLIGVALDQEELDLEGPELERLHVKRDSMRISKDSLLEIRIIMQGKPKWCFVCPRLNKQAVI